MYPYRDPMMGNPAFYDTVNYSFSLVVQKGISFCPFGEVINHR